MLCAAVLLSVSGQCVAGYGAVEVETESRETFPKERGWHKVDTKLKGVIDVKLISVTLPSEVEFRVNPESEFSLGAPGAQMDNPSPDKFTVTNDSSVPIRLEIASVEKVEPGDVSYASPKGESSGPVQAFKLVDRIAGVNAYGTAILVLGEAGKTYPNEVEFEKHAICPGKVGIPVVERIEAGETAELQIYGKVKEDFYGAYEFTVRPTLKISAVRSQ